MSRFRIPPRVGPSPAAGEPGLQNAAARLRSSRDVQAKLLEERRANADRDTDRSVTIEHPGLPASAATPETEQQGSDEVAGADTLQASQSDLATRPRKEKLVVLLRLPLAKFAQVALIKGTAELGEAYVLKAIAKEGRAVLRKLKDHSDLETWLYLAKETRTLTADHMTLGEAMTIYVQPDALAAMYSALGDPWRVLPKATIAGAFLTAIVTRLIEARLEP